MAKSMNSQQFKDELDAYLGSGFPLLAIQTSEELRIDDIIFQVAKGLSKQMYVYSEVAGKLKEVQLDVDGNMKVVLIDGDYDVPLKLLDHLYKHNTKYKESIFVLKDFNAYFKHPKIMRYLRELELKLKALGQNIIFTGPVINIPPELEKDIVRIELPLPTRKELEDVMNALIDDFMQAHCDSCDACETIVDVSSCDDYDDVAPQGTDIERIVDAASGLTTVQAEDAFSKSLRVHSKFVADEIIRTKSQLLASTGILEFYEPSVTLKEVGGFENMKEYLSVRSGAFTKEARDFGITPPKGLLITGIPDTGKSLSAIAIASYLGLPLLRLDLGKVYSSLVGESEKNIREAFAIAEAMSPAILWVDEIEKGLAGAKSSGKTDSGVSARVFGTLLTWMSEKTSSVMVVATANNVYGIPPEMLRAGRFDKLFWVAVPTASERKEIFKIHIKKKKRKVKNFDMDAIVAQTVGFTGSEIEETINGAMFLAFSAGVELQTTHIIETAKTTIPLIQSMEKELTDIEAWAKNKATRVGRSEDKEEPKKSVRKRVITIKGESK